MDHAIEALRPFLEVTIERLCKEWTSKEHKKLSDCPSYGEAKALVTAIHVLERYTYGGVITYSVKDLVELQNVKKEG